jgi:hypothetical protein
MGAHVIFQESSKRSSLPRENGSKVGRNEEGQRTSPINIDKHGGNTSLRARDLQQNHRPHEVFDSAG